MGGYHLAHLGGRARRGELNVAAVCDVDENRLANASKRAGPKAGVYRDYRYLIDRKDIDAVVFGTPDHWHGVQTVHAAERGKHVYVEKPACCTIEEGKAMVAAANKFKVSVQVGSQGRSESDCHAACTYLRNGMLGKVRKVTCWHYSNPVGGDGPDRPCPPELDWDLWLGPMRWRPYNPAYCHGTFRWFLESGGGQIRDRGAHVMSCALYLMDADQTGPVTIEAKGTAPTHGLWDCPVDMEVTYTFKDPDWVMTWSQPGVIPPKEAGVGHNDYGAVYHGDKDNLILYGGDGGTWTQKKAREFKVPAGGVEVYKSPGHKEDWFQGIKTGKKTIMNIQAAVATANLCILGNIAYILGRKIQWDPAKQEIVGDELAHRMMSRPQRFPYHL
jgi:predicted dehydrogenase